MIVVCLCVRKKNVVKNKSLTVHLIFFSSSSSSSLRAFKLMELFLKKKTENTDSKVQNKILAMT